MPEVHDLGRSVSAWFGGLPDALSYDGFWDDDPDYDPKLDQLGWPRVPERSAWAVAWRESTDDETRAAARLASSSGVRRDPVEEILGHAGDMTPGEVERRDAWLVYEENVRVGAGVVSALVRLAASA